MRIFIVTKDGRPIHTTLDHQDAHAAYERTVQSGRYRYVSVKAIPVRTEDHQVVFSAFQG